MSSIFLTTERRKLLISNTIKLCIGLVLLGCSFFYLKNHPAEKSSILSGFEIVSQKATILSYKLTGRDTDTLEEKYNLENNYKELISTLDNSVCNVDKLANELHEKYAELRNMSNNLIAQNINTYSEFLNNTYETFQTQCPQSQ